MGSGGDTFLYARHSVDVPNAEFHDSVIKVSCLSDISDFPTLHQIYLRDATRCASQMFLLNLCL